MVTGCGLWKIGAYSDSHKCFSMFRRARLRAVPQLFGIDAFRDQCPDGLFDAGFVLPVGDAEPLRVCRDDLDSRLTFLNEMTDELGKIEFGFERVISDSL